jgi:hypothetical protein
MNQIRDVLKEICPVVGVSARFPAGELLDKATHCLWQLDYPSEFGPQGIRLEVSIRPVLRPPREVRLRQLLADPLAGDTRAAKCFALDAAEARAERALHWSAQATLFGGPATGRSGPRMRSAWLSP